MDINWKISYVNKSYPSCMPFELFKGKLFKNGKRYVKSDTRYRVSGLKERIPIIIFYMFTMNVK